MIRSVSLLTVVICPFFIRTVFCICNEDALLSLLADNGSLYHAYKKLAEPDMNCLHEHNKTEEHGRAEENENCTKFDEEKEMFYLLTPRNPDDHQALVTGDGDVLEKSDFDKSIYTVLFFHGWLGDYRNSTINLIKTAYLDNLDHNVIMVDWKKYSSIWYHLTPKYLKHVANQTANFLLFLKKAGVDSSKIHLMGFNVGGHVAYYTAEILKDDYKIGRVTGLDIIMPEVCDKELKKYFVRIDINASFASFVDCIHTSLWGYTRPRCHADFYPDGGIQQQGCRLEEDIVGSCSHVLVCDYYASSIKNPDRYVGRKCNSTFDITITGCTGIEVPMGFTTPPTTRGFFYVDTAKTKFHQKKSSAAVTFISNFLKYTSIISILFV